MNPKAMEAELIQKATQTAIVAARSILMSGGTEESALKTAKAAAESVLNPAGSDTETVSGRSSLGNAFGGKRRKAKRQAEVVASMALMSATSLQPTGSNMMGDCNSINKMCGRNIITVRQDEPSVLSGSTRPPKPPTPKSIASVGGFSFKRRNSQQKEMREPAERSAKSERPPLPPASPQSMLSSAYNNLVSGNEDETEILSHQLGVKTLSHSSTMDSERDSSVDSSLQGRSGSEDESDEETAAFFFEKSRKEKASSRSKAKKNSPWSLHDAIINPIISPFTTTLNLLHCGQAGEILGIEPRLEWRGKDKKRSSRRSGRSRARESSIMESRDDTFDDETTAFSYNPKKGTYRDNDFPNSYSSNSYNSEISGFSEQELNVRSSIRETMENIVSKSNLGYRSKGKSDKKAASSKAKSTYESPRNKVSSMTSPKNLSSNTKRASAPASTRSPAIKDTKTKGRARSFFKRR